MKQEDAVPLETRVGRSTWNLARLRRIRNPDTPESSREKFQLESTVSVSSELGGENTHDRTSRLFPAMTACGSSESETLQKAQTEGTKWPQSSKI